MIAAILGIFKAGAAYVPLDPTYPKKRIQDIVLDSGLRYVLTEDHLVQHFSELDLDLLSLKKAETFAQSMKFERFEAIADSDTESVAYVIYTSGSTGRPKGVQICHTSTVAFLHWAATVFSSRELQKVLFSTSINFDLSIFEMFGPLSTGGCCVVVENILQLLEQHPSISMINTVPSAMRTLLERDALPAGVEVINLAGEPLSAKIVNDLLERGLCKRVLNLYGPTEDTTYSSYAVFDAPIKVAPHIGRAIAGTLFFVLGEHGQLLPWGAIGELYIGGRGLAKGYLNNPDLTSQKFIDATNFGMPGVRLYRTGDLVRYDWSGDLEYLGRNDEQVKIRGFRIELGEVQRCFESGVEVESAAVIVRELQQELFLAAFVVRSPTGNDLAARESDDEWLRQLRHFVDKSLPKYMAPSFLTTLKELPLTANGKVDKRALMKLEPVLFEGIEMIGPESDTEEKLVGLVGALLGQDAGKIGVTASLFELGGHSLILVRLANQVQLELGVSLPMDEYFQASHIRDMGRRIDEQAAFQNVSKMAQDAALISSGYL
jgi:amino acid adenylation domain-containing protein